MSGETVKVQGWQPQQPPPPNETEAMRTIVVESVFALFNESRLPPRMFTCDLNQIYRRCQQKVRLLREEGEWSFPYRGKRTWDRRVNEAASPKHGAKIIAVSAGLYRPHQKMFEGEG